MGILFVYIVAMTLRDEGCRDVELRRDELGFEINCSNFDFHSLIGNFCVSSAFEKLDKTPRWSLDLLKGKDVEAYSGVILLGGRDQADHRSVRTMMIAASSQVPRLRTYYSLLIDLNVAVIVSGDNEFFQ